jgi:hypothetical protein
MSASAGFELRCVLTQLYVKACFQAAGETVWATTLRVSSKATVGFSGYE